MSGGSYVGEALVAGGGVVVAAVIAFLTARHTAAKALAGVQATNATKEGEIGQGYIKWACDMLSSPDAQTRRRGLAILSELEDHAEINAQGKSVIKASLRAHVGLNPPDRGHEGLPRGN
jgi:hypothetical protein